MNEKIYLNIYRSGHVLVSALNVCEIKSPLVHELSQYGCTRAQAMLFTLLPLLGLIVGAAVVWSNLP